MAQIVRTAAASLRNRLLLGTALAMLTAAPAYAQVSGMTGASAQSNGTAPTFNNGTPGRTAITLNGSRTLIDWNTFDIGSTDTATYYFQDGKDIVLNRVKIGSANIDGTLEGRVGTPASSQYGGNIWVLARDGVIFGANARISTGGLLASTATTIEGGDAAFLGTSGTFAVGMSGAADGSKVQVLNGAQIRGYGGALAFIAPEVTTAAGSQIGKGTLTGTPQSPVPTSSDIASTQVLYGAANKYTVQFAPEAGNDLSLVKFAVPDTASGSVAATPLSLAGTTDAGDIYLAAVSRAGVINAAIDISGTLVATRASTVGGTIILGSGGSTGVVETAADGSDVDLRLTGSITAGTSIGAKVSGHFVSTGSISLAGPFDAGGTRIEAGGAISVTDISSTGGSSLDLVGASVTAGTLTGAHDVYVEARSGAINVTRASAGDDILMKASQGGITLGGAILTGLSNVADVPIASRGDTGGSGHRQLYLNARDKITLGAASPAAITAANVLSMAGSTRNGTIISGGDVEINLGSGGSAPKLNTISAGNGAADIRITSLSQLPLGQLTARDIIIDLGINNLDMESAADVRRDYLVRAGAYFQNSLNPLQANLRDLSVTITGASMSFGSFSLTAGRNLTVIAEATASGNIGFNNLTALTGNVTFTAAKDIYNSGNVTAQGDITIQSLTGGIRVVKDVTATTGNLSLLSADNGSNTTSLVDGMVRVGGNNYTLRGGEISGFGNTLKPIFTGSGPANFNIIDTAGGLTLPASINVTGNLNITVQGANNSFGIGAATLTVGGNLSVSADLLSFGTRPTIGGNYSVTGTNFFGKVLEPIFTNGGNNFSIVDTAGGLDLLTTNLAAPGTLSIEVQGAGANLTVNGLSAGGDLLLKAGGTLNVKQAATVTGNYAITAQDFTGFAFQPVGMAASSDFTIVDTAGGLTLGALNVGGTLNVRAENGDLTIAGPISSANEDIALSTTGGGAIALNGNVTTGSSRSVFLNASGNITQTGMIGTGTLTGSATGSAMLTGANLIATLGDFSANGFSLNDTAGGLLVSGNVSGGTGTARIVTTGDIDLGGAGRLRGREVILSATGALDNAAGAGAIAATDRWLVYLGSHLGNNFNNLDSGATAIWNAALASKDPGTISGTHYVFNYLPTLTFRSLNLSKTYGQTLALGTPVAGTHYSISGLLESVAGAYQGDTLSSVLSGMPSLSSLGAGAQARVVGGGYGIGIGLGSLQSLTGYALQFDGSGILTVNRKTLSAAASVQNKVYDGLLDAQGTFTLNGVEAWDTGNVSATGSFRFQNKNAGVRGVDALYSLAGSASGNYDLTLPSGLVAEIFRKKLTLTFDANNRVYDGTVSATGVARSLNGVVGSEAVGWQNLVFEFDSKDAGNRRARLVGGGLSGNASVISNYELDIAGTGAVDALIVKKGLKVDFRPRDKTYDSLPGATADILAILGLVGSETVGLVDPSFAFASYNAGTHLVRMTGGSLSGAASGNYYIDTAGMAGIAANILKKGVTFDFGVGPRQYNGGFLANALVRNMVGVYAVDASAVGMSDVVFQYDGKDVGNHLVRLTSGSLTGSASGNYFIDFANQGTVLGRIDPRILTVNALVATRQYNGGVDASGTLTLGNLVAGEEALVRIDGAAFRFRDKNASATAKAVDITGGMLTGAGSSNYTVAIPAQTTGFITRKALNVSANVGDKTYDGTAAATGTYTYDGIVGGDVLTVAQGRLEFEDKNVGTDKRVFLRDAVLGGADSANYEVSFTTSAGLADISRRDVHASASVSDKTYNGQRDASGTIGGFTGYAAGDEGINATGVFAFLDKNASGSAKAVQMLSALLGADYAGNYNLIVDNAGALTAFVNRRDVHATASILRKIYDGQLGATGTIGGFTGYAAGDEGINATGAFAFLDKNASGNARPVRMLSALLGAGYAGNYNLIVDNAGALTGFIDRRDLHATASILRKIYDNSLDATGTIAGFTGQVAGETGDAAGIFAFLDKNASDSAKAARLLSYTLTGDFANNYNLVLDNAGALAGFIDRRALTVGAAAARKTYDGRVTAQGSFSLGNYAPGEEGSLRIADAVFSFADKNASANAKRVLISGGTLAGVGSGNYSVVIPLETTGFIDKALLRVSASVVDKEYDRTTAATGTYSYEGRVDNDDVQVIGGRLEFEDRNAGKDKKVYLRAASLGGLDKDNYDIQFAEAAGTASINPKAITAAVTPHGRDYNGGTAAEADVVLNDILAGDAVGYNGTFTFASKNAGRQQVFVELTLTGQDGGNYTVSIPGPVFGEIARKALGASALVDRRAYDGTTRATGSVALTGVEAVDAGKVHVDGATFTFDTRNAGRNKVVTISGGRLAGDEAANYSVTMPDMAQGEITQKALGISASVVTRDYNGKTDAQGSFSLSGVEDVDAGKVSVDGATFAFETKDAGGNKVVRITGGQLAGDAASNYSVEIPAQAWGEIAQKVLGIRAIVGTREYDGTTRADGRFELAGIEAVDAGKVSVEGAAFTFATKNAGKDKVVTITGGHLSGAESSNYSVTIPLTALAEITRKALGVSAKADDKEYDGTTKASGSFDLSNVVEADLGKVFVEGATFTFDTRQAGTQKVVTITGGALAGSEAGNYSVTIPLSALANISRKVLQVSATANNKVYDGTTTTTGSVHVTGIVEGDTVGHAGGVFNFADRNAGTGKSVSVTGLTLTGADAGNYDIQMPQGVFASIARRALSIRANDASKEQRQSDPALTYVLAQGDLVSGDQLTGALARERGEAPGRYGILQGTLTGGANYDISFTPGVLSITAPTGSDQPLPTEPTADLISFVQNRAQVPSLAPANNGLVVVDAGIGCKAEDQACPQPAAQP
ncbi:filamentous hemagglutinin family protein [Sphingomonas naasensis]|uniref:Filamentous hemagglutinin N-terminal domain-containing protein n=1 Tax=Sphingomonas naasensis TaxID=1344951 RepID=A0A4S1WJK6_9SPHN|nr:YDG domain-containing protein [Sphingomonas naasensis]NIJ21001.1 filamentous hemagglutinin family protein [Sphingomonas naasensis]TGX43381.1 filamentous hemagglutinin N-terminal domain-containing protein [Sphingomonas naasensis]